MFNFFWISLLIIKKIFNTCAKHTQVNKQESVACILFARFFRLFLNSIIKILLDPQISEYNKKNYEPHQMHTVLHKTTEILHLPHKNYKTSMITNSTSHSYPLSSVTHIKAHQPKIEDKYETIVEQPHTTNFCS